MAHEDETLFEVHGVELGEGAAGAETVEDHHRQTGLEIAFAAGRNAARGKQRIAEDQAGAEALVEIAV